MCFLEQNQKFIFLNNLINLTCTRERKMQEYILYCLNTCPTCKSLLEQISKNSLDAKIFIQNVLLIKKKQPWLVGVPTLIHTYTGLMYKGSDVITIVNAEIQSMKAELEVKAYVEANRKNQKQEPGQEEKKCSDERVIKKPQGNMRSLFQDDVMNSDEFDITKPVNEKEDMKKKNNVSDNMLADLITKRGPPSKVNKLG